MLAVAGTDPKDGTENPLMLAGLELQQFEPGVKATLKLQFPPVTSISELHF
jgi:hypothetical protein